VSLNKKSRIIKIEATSILTYQNIFTASMLAATEKEWFTVYKAQ
jgi:hypothetical protein